MSSLTYIVFWPLLAALILVFVPRTFVTVMRAVAIVATFVSAVLALKVFLQFDLAAMSYQFVQKTTWVERWASTTSSAWMASMWDSCSWARLSPLPRPVFRGRSGSAKKSSTFFCC